LYQGTPFSATCEAAPDTSPTSREFFGDDFRRADDVLVWDRRFD
jgi:hypothetical protein